MSAIPSWLLVALQFALIAVLLLTTEAAGTPVANALAFACVIAGTFVGVAALAANRPGNFNVQPELKAGARLISDGIYAHIRHPMYTAVLLVMLAAVAADLRAWRVLVWLALLAVLLAKAVREEDYLRARFPEYAAYQARSARLLPRIY
ncbi:MAG: isoprenylcysteine carboxylmethyltransferase family protein [Burkholderiaceae bacterium]|nr:isoprenylcysteine carboxylmethyltransferase family protein [Burkholderiaceae bacterium]